MGKFMVLFKLSYLGDVCCNPLSIGGLQKFIQQQIPEVYVISLKIGKTIREVPVKLL